MLFCCCFLRLSLYNRQRKILDMKENPFGNMVQTATSFVSRLRTKPQVSMGAGTRPHKKPQCCVALHVNVACSVAWHTRAGAGDGSSQMAGGSSTNSVHAFEFDHGPSETELLRKARRNQFSTNPFSSRHAICM